ncbi:MAG: MFS transporter [Gammaproteobacteria bacterium]|nr:MFS transporter [Gammaproteobacteria bacterium]
MSAPSTDRDPAAAAPATHAAAHAAIAARLDRLPPSRAIWTIVLLISAGGVFEYYDLFFTAYVAPGMVHSGLFTPASLGLFATLMPIGVAGFGTFVFATFAGLWVGVVALGTAADRLGRKRVFLGSLVWYVACTTIMAFQRSGEAIDLWRFIAGVGFGVQLVTIDAYVSELVPAPYRGRAFSLNQVVSFTAVPIVALLAWLLVPHRVDGIDGWRIVVLIGSAGALVVLALARGIPESPRWLALHGEIERAERIVADLERRSGVVPPATAIAPAAAPAAAHPRAAADAQAPAARLFDRRHRGRTLMLSVFNAAQVIGFYGFNAWVPTLLIARGITVTHSLEYSFIIAIAQPIGPAVGALFADRLERRTQIVAALAVMGIAIAAFARVTDPVALIAIGVVFTLAANVMSYAFHNYQAELYPTSIRARAVGFVYSWSRLAAAFSGLAVDYFLRAGGVPAVAAFIAGAMLVAILSVALFGPSTRGLSLERIDDAQ